MVSTAGSIILIANKSSRIFWEKSDLTRHSAHFRASRPSGPDFRYLSGHSSSSSQTKLRLRATATSIRKVSRMISLWKCASTRTVWLRISSLSSTVTKHARVWPVPTATGGRPPLSAGAPAWFRGMVQTEGARGTPNSLAPQDVEGPHRGASRHLSVAWHRLSRAAPKAFGEDGCLQPDLYGDAFHANSRYGAMVLDQMQCVIQDSHNRIVAMSRHPYRSLPTCSFWRRSIADVSCEMVDPVVGAKFSLGRHDRVATAGSCFAQHIARHLRGSGFDYFVTETANPIVPAPIAEKYGYGIFTARFGNIYTSRQLVQTLHRAYGSFTPTDDVWVRGDGRLIDPFRPNSA